MGLPPRSRLRSLMSRIMVGVVTLAVTAAGSGLPMCASLLAKAATPCPMHFGHSVVSTAGVPHAPVLVAEHSPAGACHPDDAGLGCATAGACPAAGSAAPVQSGATLAAEPPAQRALWSRELAHASFLAPPLSPPPQA